MKAQELRIGNYVGLNLTEFPENYFTVVEVAESSAVFTDGLEWHPIRDRQYFEPCDVEGIPLTEDWLKRFGFVDGENYGYPVLLKDNGIGDYDEDNLLFVFHYQGDEFFKYVHQLQNLYFALTGKELTPLT